jgi:hypothetical protein
MIICDGHSVDGVNEAGDLRSSGGRRAPCTPGQLLDVAEVELVAILANGLGPTDPLRGRNMCRTDTIDVLTVVSGAVMLVLNDRPAEPPAPGRSGTCDRREMCRSAC